MPDIKQAIQDAAILTVRTEKQAWENGTAFVTEKVAFEMRNLIRQLRKNYWGIFDEPLDPVTQKKKIWIPLTESYVEAAVKNIDLDTKDINFRAKKAESIGLTSLVRAVVKNGLDEMFFGEKLDEMERQLAIDGTIVWKTYEEYNPETKKKECKIRMVDLLNFYIDPTAPAIADPETSVIERAVLTLDEVKSMKGWMNLDQVVGQTNVNRYDGEYGNFAGGYVGQGEVKLVEVYERWGKMSKFILTGEEADKDVQVDGRIVLSGTGNKWVVHLIEKTDGCKPYEEAWYTRVHGRWYGKGISEKLMMLQLYVNILVNTRITRATVSQLGIFKIKRGTGITPQMIGKLAANGALLVNNQDDIQQFVMQEASIASYKDEDIVKGWSERVTSAFEVVTGEGLPSSTPATNAAIQSRSAQSQFTFIKEGIGYFLQRWLKRQYIPKLFKYIKPSDIVRITGEVNDLKVLDERIVNELLYQKIDELTKDGIYIRNIDQIEELRNSVLEKLQKTGPDRYVKLLKEIDFTEYDVQVYVTNEEIDKGVLTQNLLTALSAAPEYREQIVSQVFDIMGIGPFKPSQTSPLLPQGGANPEMPGGTPPAPSMPVPSQNPTALTTRANTYQNAGQ